MIRSALWRQGAGGADVGHLDVRLDAELLERLLRLHPEQEPAAEAHPADRQDLHVVRQPPCWPLDAPAVTRRTRSWRRRRLRFVGGDERAHRGAVRGVEERRAAVRRPRGTRRASRARRRGRRRRARPGRSRAGPDRSARWPKGTGVASVTRLRPARRTAGEGREWASATPGAMTMYGPERLDGLDHLVGVRVGGHAARDEGIAGDADRRTPVRGRRAGPDGAGGEQIRKESSAVHVVTR